MTARTSVTGRGEARKAVIRCMRVNKVHARGTLKMKPYIIGGRKAVTRVLDSVELCWPLLPIQMTKINPIYLQFTLTAIVVTFIRI